jgi:hypothetical protein
VYLAYQIAGNGPVDLVWQPEAIRYLESGRAVGKVVITVGD